MIGSAAYTVDHSHIVVMEYSSNIELIRLDNDIRCMKLNINWIGKLGKVK